VYIYYAIIISGSYKSYSWVAALLMAVEHMLQLVIQHHLICQGFVPRDENRQIFPADEVTKSNKCTQVYENVL
jgi:hypothetical protein